MVLHELHQRVDRFPAEVVLAATGQGVRLVDQQHAAECGLEGSWVFSAVCPTKPATSLLRSVSTS